MTKVARVHSDMVQFGTRFKVPVNTETDSSTGFGQFGMCAKNWKDMSGNIFFSFKLVGVLLRLAHGRACTTQQIWFAKILANQ